ncbi:hypothetical protein SAMN06295912_12831 [Sphingomonas laterariae]|uniref:Uncharacterized protein n=1 Tax=Edaphosphingomonas laterariae TaxID=861865 RepID=A0A239IYK2_9SPHN|nr:hypothetical protein [Sphingomonas laterariae]SNS98690.1 hypothetical protein SAMN06295912_12831 [Sphingomonas laterariae]
MTAIGAADDTAQREILVDILAGRRTDLARQPILDDAKVFEGNQAFVLGFAKRHVPALNFDIASIEGLGQELTDAFIRHQPVFVCREGGTGLKETLDLTLRRKAPRGETFEGFPNDGGQRFVADKNLAAARLAFITIAPRRLEHPIATHDAGTHTVLGLFGIFTTMLASKCRFDDLKDIVVGIIGVNPLGGHQFAACLRHGIADSVVRAQRPSEAVEIVNNDDGLLPAAFQKGEQILDARTIG